MFYIVHNCNKGIIRKEKTISDIKNHYRL